jgi:FAD/FMN-containing dehydrogenase
VKLRGTSREPQEGTMSELAKQLSGEDANVSDESLEQLRAELRGPVLTAHDAGYDAARVVYNAAIDRRPAIIAKCTGTADVVDAVNFAREHSLLTAVRSGGHSVCGYSVCDGGLVIDLTSMHGVWVDADARIVRVQGGATWGDVDRETQRAGLAVPGGIVSTTGVAGLTLGGGLGWLHRKHGLACDNLRSVEIVTADGSVVRASGLEHDDLFWALRGGGGNFGVVTSFEFDAHAVGPTVMLAAVAYPLETAADILPVWRDWTETVPDEITSRAVMFAPPAHPALPPELHDRDVAVIAALYTGPVEEGERIMQPIRHLGAPVLDLSGPLPYRAVQSMFDLFGHGVISGYWKSLYLDRLDADTLDVVVRRTNKRPAPLAVTHIPTMGGAVSNLAPTDTAFGDRSAPYMLSVDGQWIGHDDASPTITWVRDFVAEAESLASSKGTYLNFQADTDDATRGAQYGDNLDRLRRIKRNYDPDNLFRLNNNIEPV